jgi:toxin-antitoxin system PIN domain toxin
VKPYLLDVNVLIALAWPSHVHHHEAQDWFGRVRKSGFRTCPLTQTGFVRISCNPKFTPDAVSPADAMALLDRITALPQHAFWPDDLVLGEALRAERLLIGHRQISDAYLVALASAHRGVLATFDRGVLSLSGAAKHGAVELLQ